jgi:hypothetical protein
MPADDSPAPLPAPATGRGRAAGSPEWGDCDQAVVSRPAAAPMTTADG